MGTNLYTKNEAKKMILQIHALQNQGVNLGKTLIRSSI